MKKLAILLIILSLSLAACGGGDSDSDADAENTNGNEQTTSVTTEEAPAETDATEEVIEEVDLTAEADMTEEAMEQSAETDATEEAMEETAEADATEEAVEEIAETDATEEATDENSEVVASGPVTISGFNSLEEGCPTLFQFQYPPNWTILRSGGARVTFEIATDSGVNAGLIEYRGGVAPNQIQTNYQRFADLDTTTLIHTLVIDGQEYPIYQDDRTTNSGPVNYYYFFLPGRNLADNVRMTIQPNDSGDFPPDEEMVQMLSTIVPNSCF